MTVIRSREQKKKMHHAKELHTLHSLPSSPRFPYSRSKNVLSIFQNYKSIYNEMSGLFDQFDESDYPKLERLITRVYRYITEKFKAKIDVYKTYSMELHYFSFLSYENIKLHYNLTDAEVNIIFITYYIGSGVRNPDIELTLKLLGQPYSVTRYISNLIKRGFIYRKKSGKPGQKQYKLIYTTSKGTEVIKMYSKIISQMIFNYKSEFYARRKAMKTSLKRKK